MSDEAIIEASMLIHRDSLHELIALARADALENIVISYELLRMAEDGQFLEYVLGRYLDIPYALIDLETISRFIPMLRDRVRVYGGERSRDDPTYRNLLSQTGDERIAGILFDEWEFLTSHSWLFSKSRKALDDMVEAGSAAFYLSQDKFNHVTRRLLNKQDRDPLSPNDKIKAAAKWVAMGGSSVWGLFEPISGAVAGFASGVFILSDP